MEVVWEEVRDGAWSLVEVLKLPTVTVPLVGNLALLSLMACLPRQHMFGVMHLRASE